MSQVSPPSHRFREEYMATYFEIHIVHDDATYARQAARAAFAMADRLEQMLSRFREESEVARIRQLAPGEILRLNAATFACLQLALELHRLTRGAFDPALGAQMDRVRNPAAEIDANPPTVRGRLLMDPATFSVKCLDAPVHLDLGAIGKGFALDQMRDVLLEWEIECALLIAGGSSLLALHGTRAPGAAGWEVYLNAKDKIVLHDSAIGSSGIAVKGAHILDPRQGIPVPGPFRTWALAPSAAVADALSTAWMLLAPEEIAEVCRESDGVQAILQLHENRPEDLIRIGAGSGATT